MLFRKRWFSEEILSRLHWIYLVEPWGRESVYVLPWQHTKMPKRANYPLHFLSNRWVRNLMVGYDSAMGCCSDSADNPPPIIYLMNIFRRTRQRQCLRTCKLKNRNDELRREPGCVIWYLLERLAWNSQIITCLSLNDGGRFRQRAGRRDDEI